MVAQSMTNIKFATCKRSIHDVLIPECRDNFLVDCSLREPVKQNYINKYLSTITAL